VTGAQDGVIGVIRLPVAFDQLLSFQPMQHPVDCTSLGVQLPAKIALQDRTALLMQQGQRLCLKGGGVAWSQFVGRPFWCRRLSLEESSTATATTAPTARIATMMTGAYPPCKPNPWCIIHTFL
jgi:hypothetical protein